MVMGKGRRSGSNPLLYRSSKDRCQVNEGNSCRRAVCSMKCVMKIYGIKGNLFPDRSLSSMRGRCPCKRMFFPFVRPGAEEIGWPRVKSVVALCFSIGLFVRVEE